MLWNHSSLHTFLSLTVKAHVHTVTHAWSYESHNTYVKRAVLKAHLRWIGHSRSFKVILIDAGRNPERRVVVMCNANVISDTYEDIATGKLQIRRFQRPHHGFKTLFQNHRISRNNLHWDKLVIDVHFCCWQHWSMFVNFHAIIFESQALWVKKCWPTTDYDMK